MEKKWYKVTFYASMTDEDVRAMKKYFYQSLEGSMDISPCEGLIIEKDTQAVENTPITTLELEEDCYAINPFNGVLRIDKQIYDDYIKDEFVNIKFLDEENQPVSQYQMVDEDEDWIYCEYMTDIS